MVYVEHTTLDAMRYVRQKTRTTSAIANLNPAGVAGGNVGAWPDEIVVDYLNHSLRHIVTALSIEYMGAYYGVLAVDKALLSGPPISYLIEDGSGTEYGAIRPSWVRYGISSADTNLRGHPIPEITHNRRFYDTAYRSVRTVPVTSPQPAETGKKASYYTVSEKDSGTDKRVIRLVFEGVPVTETVDVFHYRFPDALDRGLSAPNTEQIPLPPICWNAFLDYAVILCLEDELNPRMGPVLSRYQRAEAALMAGGIFNYDMPSGPVERERAAMDVMGKSQ